MKLSTEDAAYCAAAWASGEKQKSLAATFGCKSATTICLAIRAFLNAYATAADVHEVLAATNRLGPPADQGWQARTVYDACIYGGGRKALVPAALRNFRSIRGE